VLLSTHFAANTSCRVTASAPIVLTAIVTPGVYFPEMKCRNEVCTDLVNRTERHKGDGKEMMIACNFNIFLFFAFGRRCIIIIIIINRVVFISYNHILPAT